MRTIRVPVQFWRGRHKKRGVSCVKVSPEGVPWLLGSGWTLIHRAHYCYLSPPNEDRSTWYVELDVPTREDVIGLAEDIHAADRDWRGKAWGFDVKYTARKIGVEDCRVICPTTGEQWTEESLYDRPARFWICAGAEWPWSVLLTWNQNGRICEEYPPEGVDLKPGSPLEHDRIMRERSQLL